MLALIKKAKWIFLLVFTVYALSFVTGYSAGALKLVNYQEDKKFGLFQGLQLTREICARVWQTD